MLINNSSSIVDRIVSVKCTWEKGGSVSQGRLGVNVDLCVDVVSYVLFIDWVV